MTSERRQAGQRSSLPPPQTAKKTARKSIDQPVPWYGRLLIISVLIGATIEFFRLLLLAIMTN